MFHKARVLQWFLQYFSLSAFTIFLHYFPFTNTFFTLIPVSYTVSPFSFYSFYNVSYKESSEKEETYIYVHTQGKTGVAGSPLFMRYDLLFFS